MEKQRSSPDPEGRRERPPRRPYRAPSLTEYGPIAKLTQMMVGTGADGGPSGNRRMCL
jgi:hypothetical protein